MFALRTLTTVGLVLVLAAGVSAADKKGRPGNYHPKGKVQQRDTTKGAPRNARVGGKMHLEDVSLGFAPKSGARAAR